MYCTHILYIFSFVFRKWRPRETEDWFIGHHLPILFSFDLSICLTIWPILFSTTNSRPIDHELTPASFIRLDFDRKCQFTYNSATRLNISLSSFLFLFSLACWTNQFYARPPASTATRPASLSFSDVLRACHHQSSKRDSIDQTCLEERALLLTFDECVTWPSERVDPTVLCVCVCT